MLSDLLNSRSGTIILSILWGLGLATMFKKSCEGKDCKIYRYVSPDPHNIKSTYYNYGTYNCYQYDPVISSCQAQSGV